MGKLAAKEGTGVASSTNLITELQARNDWANALNEMLDRPQNAPNSARYEVTNTKRGIGAVIVPLAKDTATQEDEVRYLKQLLSTSGQRDVAARIAARENQLMLEEATAQSLARAWDQEKIQQERGYTTFDFPLHRLKQERATAAEKVTPLTLSAPSLSNEAVQSWLKSNLGAKSVHFLEADGEEYPAAVTFSCPEGKRADLERLFGAATEENSDVVMEEPSAGRMQVTITDAVLRGVIGKQRSSPHGGHASGFAAVAKKVENPASRAFQAATSTSLSPEKTAETRTALLDMIGEGASVIFVPADPSAGTTNQFTIKAYENQIQPLCVKLQLAHPSIAQRWTNTLEKAHSSWSLPKRILTIDAAPAATATEAYLARKDQIDLMASHMVDISRHY